MIVDCNLRREYHERISAISASSDIDRSFELSPAETHDDSTRGVYKYPSVSKPLIYPHPVTLHQPNRQHHSSMSFSNQDNSLTPMSAAEREDYAQLCSQRTRDRTDRITLTPMSAEEWKDYEKLRAERDGATAQSGTAVSQTSGSKTTAQSLSGAH